VTKAFEPPPNARSPASQAAAVSPHFGGAADRDGSPSRIADLAAAQGGAEERVRKELRQSRDEALSLRQGLSQKESEVRELKTRVLKLRDELDEAALSREEEMHAVRQQTEMEARGYRGRQQRMTELVSQLRQDVMDAQQRAEEVGAERDRLVRDKEERAREAIAAEQRIAALEMELGDQAREVEAMRMQRSMWEGESERMAERVARAEALTLEMRDDCTQTAQRSSTLRAECDAAQIRAEELKLQLLQAQRREAEMRRALDDVTASGDHLGELRRENEELRERELERDELVRELRLEKHKMMQHLQAGIKERQEVIDSVFTRGGGLEGNPELQLKVIEVEQLRAELAHCVHKAEEEAGAQRDLVNLLRQRNASADSRCRQLTEENQKLRAELDLALEGNKDQKRLHEKYQRTTEELEQALRDVSAVRQELQQERELEEKELRERVSHTRKQFSLYQDQGR